MELGNIWHGVNCESKFSGFVVAMILCNSLFRDAKEEGISSFDIVVTRVLGMALMAAAVREQGI